MSFVYARQSRVGIFLPSAGFVYLVFGTAHFAKVLNTVVGLDTIDMIDLLGKATAYEEEHQAVLPKLKPFSSEKDIDADIAATLINHSRILAVPLPVDQLPRLFIISVSRKEMFLKRPPLLLC